MIVAHTVIVIAVVKCRGQVATTVTINRGHANKLNLFPFQFWLFEPVERMSQWQCISASLISQFLLLPALSHRCALACKHSMLEQVANYWPVKPICLSQYLWTRMGHTPSSPVHFAQSSALDDPEWDRCARDNLSERERPGQREHTLEMEPCGTHSRPITRHGTEPHIQNKFEIKTKLALSISGMMDAYRPRIR